MLTALTNFWNWFCRDEDGAVMVEYALLVALIALVVIGSVQTFGSNLAVLYSQIAANITT
jgi:pilus assembly protein Flp/PilA